MRRGRPRDPNFKAHQGKRRGEPSFEHPPRQDFPPRLYGKDESHHRSSYSPGRQGRHQQHFNSTSAQSIQEFRNQGGGAPQRNSPSRDHLPLSGRPSFTEQSPVQHPQLSSNPTTAALEASLLFLTELATNLNPGVSVEDPQCSALDTYIADAQSDPLPELMDIHFRANHNRNQRLHDVSPDYRGDPVDKTRGYGTDIDQRRPGHIRKESPRLSHDPVHIEGRYGEGRARSSSYDANRHTRGLADGSIYSSSREVEHSVGMQDSEILHSGTRHGDRMSLMTAYSENRHDGPLCHAYGVSGSHGGGIEVLHSRLGGRRSREGISHESQGRMSRSSEARNDDGQGIIHVRGGISSSIYTERFGQEQGANCDDMNGMVSGDTEFAKHRSDGWYNHDMGYSKRVEPTTKIKVECDDFLPSDNRSDSDLKFAVNPDHLFDHMSSDESSPWDSQSAAFDDHNLPRPTFSKNSQPIFKGSAQPRPAAYEESQCRVSFSGSTSSLSASSHSNNSRVDDHCFSSHSSPHKFSPILHPDSMEHHLRKRKQDSSVSPIAKKHCESDVQHRQSETYRGSSYSHPHPSTGFRPRDNQPKVAVEKRLGPQPEEHDATPRNLQARLGPSISDPDMAPFQDLRMHLSKYFHVSGRSVPLTARGSSEGHQMSSSASLDSVHKPPGKVSFPHDEHSSQSFKVSSGSPDSSLRPLAYDNSLPRSSDLPKTSFASSYNAHKQLVTKGTSADKRFPPQTSVATNVLSATPVISKTHSMKSDEDTTGKLSSVAPSRKEISNDRHLAQSSLSFSDYKHQNTEVSHAPKPAALHQLSLSSVPHVLSNAKTPVSVTSNSPVTALPDIQVVAKKSVDSGSVSFRMKEVEKLPKSPITSKEMNKTMTKKVKAVSKVDADSGKKTTHSVPASSVKAKADVNMESSVSVAASSKKLVEQSKTQERILSSKPMFPLLGKNIILPFSQPEWDVRPAPSGKGEVSGTRSKASGIFEKPPLLYQENRNSLPDLHLDSCDFRQQSDSEESECGLVIDMNRVPDSPCTQRSDPFSSPCNRVSENSESKPGRTLSSGTAEKTEYNSIARDELGLDLFNQLLKSKPSPLCALYNSIQLVICSINRWEIPMSTVLQAFRSYALSEAKYPFSLSHLYRMELASLKKKCLLDVEKWKVQIEVFRLLSSTLSKRKDLISNSESSLIKNNVESQEQGKTLSEPHISSCAERAGQQSLSQERNLSVLSCDQGEVKPASKVSVKSLSGGLQRRPVSTIDLSFISNSELEQGEYHMVTRSDASESGECNMSVCSTLSDGELPKSSDLASPVMENVPLGVALSGPDMLGNSELAEQLQENSNYRHKHRSVSLSSGELTPSPPLTPIVQDRMKNSFPPIPTNSVVTSGNKNTKLSLESSKCNTTLPIVRSSKGSTTPPLPRTNKVSTIPPLPKTSKESPTPLPRTSTETTVPPLPTTSKESPAPPLPRTSTETTARAPLPRTSKESPTPPLRRNSMETTAPPLPRTTKESRTPLLRRNSKESTAPPIPRASREPTAPSSSRSTMESTFKPLVRSTKESTSQPLVRSGKDSSTTRPLVRSNKDSATQQPLRYFGSYSRDSQNLHGIHSHTFSTSANQSRPYHRKRSRSRERSRYIRRSRSPISRSRRSDSPRPIARQRNSSSRSPTSRCREYDPRRKLRSRSPPSKKGNKRYDRRQRSSLNKGSEEDEDIELLQLKKEVILSIVQKPEVGKSDVKAVTLKNSKVNPVCDNQSTLSSLTSKESLGSGKEMKKKRVSASAVIPAPTFTSSKNQSDGVRSAEVVAKSQNLKLKSKKVLQVNSKPSTTVPATLVLGSQKIKPSLTRKPKSSPNTSRVGSSGPSSPVMPVAELQGPLPNIKSPTESIAGSPVPSSEANSEKSVSVMVFPGKESTWKIQPFQITSSGCDSDSEVGDQDPDPATAIAAGGISEISSFLVEARKVASQSSARGTSLRGESLDLPTPPASLPPARKKEYMILKKRIALHEKNLNERKKKRLSNNNSRSSSPHSLSHRKTAPCTLPIKSSENSDSKLSSPLLPLVANKCAEDATSLESSAVREKETEKQSDVVEGHQKELADCMKKMEHHKLLEEQEQQKITELTNHLTECVSEIEEHERDIECVQKQVEDLQKQLENAGLALKNCEQKMNDLNNSVRCAQLKKSEYGNTVMECKLLTRALEMKIDSYKYEIELESISDSEVVVPDMMTGVSASKLNSDSSSSSLANTALPQHVLEVEPISDAEDVGTEDRRDVDFQQTSPIVVELMSGSEPVDYPSKAQLLLVNTESDLFECKDKSIESDTGPASVSKEIVVRSSDSSVCRHTELYDKPSKLDKMLNAVMHSALKFPRVESKNQPPSLLSVSNDTTLLSPEANVQPLLNSVMSSLTQQSFKEVLATVHADPVRECDDQSLHSVSSTKHYDGRYADDSNLDSCFHTCTEDPFTLSRDDPPMLVLPVVFEGKFNLGIQSPSISSVAMEAVNDALVKPVGDSVKHPFEPKEGGAMSGAKVCQDIDEYSSFIGDVISTSDGLHPPQSLKTPVIPSLLGKSDFISETGKKRTDLGDKIGQSSTLSKSVKRNQTKMKSSLPFVQSRPIIELSKSKSKLTTDKSTSDSSLVKGKPSSHTSTNPNPKLSNVPKVVSKTESKSNSQGENVPQIPSTRKSKPISDLIEGKSKPVSTLTESKPIIKSESAIGQAESNAKPGVSVMEGKTKLVGSSVQGKVKFGNQTENNPKPGVGLPDGMPMVSDQSLSKPKPAVNVSLKAADMVQLEPEKIKTILQKHIDQIEEVKGQLAVAKSGAQKMDPTETCARTSGLRVAPPVLLVDTFVTGPEEVFTMAQTFIEKIISIHDSDTLVSKTGSSDGPVAVGVPLNFTVHDLLSSNCVIKNPSLSLSPLNLSESVLDSLSPSTSSIPLINTEEGYKPYCSPLLMFGSYRLSPCFSSSAKAPLSSITYSNKLFPNHIMCRFELTGTCSDSSCTAQHMRDLEMTKEELVQDLVSYSPTLTGCTDQELADVGTTQAKSTDLIPGKLSSFSSKFLMKYADKVSDEELWKLVVYETNKERVKTKPRRDVVSFEDRPWTEYSEASCQALSSSRSLERTSTHLLSLLPKVEQRKRYFSVEEKKSTEPSSSSETISNFVSSAQKLVAENNLQQAIITLEEGLKICQDSEEMWLIYLQLKSEVTSDSDIQSLYGLFSKAVDASHSYAVVLETIRLSRCYKSKLKVINAGLVLARSLTPSDVASHCSFELFINVVLLDLQAGKLSAAAKHLDQARRCNDQEQSATSNNNFAGLLGVLERQECILLCLCHLTVSYSNSLPVSLFMGDSHHIVPARLSSYQFFAIPFDSSVHLPSNSYKKILRLFKFYLDLLHDSSLPSSQAVERILPLFRNVILFETMHGSHQKAINILVKLTLLCPHLSDLWMMLARIKELEGMDGCEVMEEAVHSSPMKPELYYLAARLELSRVDTAGPETSSNKCIAESCDEECRGHSHHVGKAVEWLSRCIRSYYESGSPAEMSTAQVLTLYRKLLNQMIGYQQTVPAFMEGVDPRNMKEAQCPLWMCYCLLVELTVVPSTSVSGAELFHQSAEDAYESGIHAVHSPDGHKTLWREYVYYMRAKVADGSREEFQQLLDCVHRCVMDVDCCSATGGGQSSAPASASATGSGVLCADYSFHNEMISVVTAYLPPSSAFKFTALRKFARKFPKNTTLLTELVQCALLQKPPSIDVAQTTLAEFLALHPQSPTLWKQAIEVELQLGHVKEARWMFNKALQTLPLHIQLWKDFVVFELKEVIASVSGSSSSSCLDTSSRRIADLVERARHYGIDLLLVLRDLASSVPPTL